MSRIVIVISLCLFLCPFSPSFFLPTRMEIHRVAFLNEFVTAIFARITALCSCLSTLPVLLLSSQFRGFV
jgi:hypothetical protein